jgi:protein TonB
MKNNITAFAISFFIHLAVIAGIILGGRGIKPIIKDVVTLDVSTIFEEKAPAAPKTEERAAVIPEAKPPEKPKPPKPKDVPKPAPKPTPKQPAKQTVQTEPDAVPEAVSDERNSVEETADSGSVEASEGTPQETSTPVGSAGGGAEESAEGIRAYMGKNFSYIQKRVARYTVYPPRAKRTGIKGKLTVSFIINLDGTVSDVAIAKSSGHAVLDDAGIAAVKDAAPFPTPPASARIAIPISFDLL